MENLNLYGLKAGETAEIKFITGSPKIRKRLYELGFTEGTQVTVLKKSVFKGTYLLSILGSVLALPSKTLKSVYVLKNGRDKNYSIFEKQK